MPASESVRVVLLPVGDHDNEGTAVQIVLDLQREVGASRSSGPFPAFGRIGDFRRPETLFPFALMFDGRMDLGALASEVDRHMILDIRTAELLPGTVVARTTDGRHDRYVIASVTNLLAG